MASAKVTARVPPPEREGARNRPVTTGAGEPTTAHRTPADREESK
ncbi:MAG: hypothetical protein ABEJ92_03215 [Halobacteriales archaeon]